MASYAQRAAERRAELVSALKRFIAVARAYPDVRAVYVFGSMGCDRIAPRSDLDLLVVRETSLRGPERGADLAGAADLGIEFDLIVVTPDEYRDRLPTTSFGRTILETAKLAYAA
ncbi:MAG: nucleotidyltransferase domain-containing protein [Candidatus Eremiobacteraeota bacterium]|nr:nucleotidyltransferase domain-containing protein [Candidatus Eremiobacteraeota bacterium]MBC5801908.1 nucleotidyltransferase domain-containing protein [Candidatus Eremiobacteraeota bacterium]MBC5821741.1 nucleotidyltransferase domain-containing protein [Candidatus Eremiobacteraeota bacterium]